MKGWKFGSVVCFDTLVRVILVFLFLFILMFMQATTIRAEETEMAEWPPPETWPPIPTLAFGAGSISPKTPNTSIRMVSMSVKITLKPRHYHLSATFRLHNTGKDTIETIGIPKHGVRTFPVEDIPTKYYDLVHFRAIADGRRLDFTEQPIFTERHKYLPGWRKAEGLRGEGNLYGSETRWLVAQVGFPEHAERMIQFQCDGYYKRTPWEAVLPCFADFYLGTASYWKGAIGKVQVVVDSNEVRGKAREVGRILGIFPGKYQDCFQNNGIKQDIEKNTVKYEIKDTLPPYQAYVSFGPGFLLRTDKTPDKSKIGQ